MQVIGGMEAQTTKRLGTSMEIQVERPVVKVRILNMVEVLVTTLVIVIRSKMTLILSEGQLVRVVAAQGNTDCSKS